ncbi:MAG: fatty acid desaturase family protein [Pseudomonadota bacterium]
MTIPTPPPSTRLDDGLRHRLRQLSTRFNGPRAGAFHRALGFDYGVLMLTIGAMTALSFGPAFWLLLPLAWLIIAARQHAILVLLHDATHGLAHPRRGWNEVIGELACGAPMFVTMSKYRKDHLAHHRELNSAADPDWVRKLGSTAEARFWQFPLSTSASRFLLWSWFGSVCYLLRSFTHLSAGTTAGGEAAVATSPGYIRPLRTGLYLGLAGALTVFGGWLLFLLLWVAPVLLVLPLIMRIRSIAEHFALPNEQPLNASRNVVCGPLEAFLLAPHNVNLHLDHHLLPGVSFTELPALHRSLQEAPGYAAAAHQNDGYFLGARTLLHDMLGRESTTRKQPSKLGRSVPA